MEATNDKKIGKDVERVVSVRRRSASALAVGALLAIGVKPALAWDGEVVGVVSNLEITDANNQGFRVYLNSGMAMCTNGANWAYINEADSNYKVYVAALMAAKADKSPVRIYSTFVSGYCHIGYIAIN